MEKTIDFQLGMSYGMGVDTLQLNPLGVGVTGDTPAAVPGAEGQTVQFSLTKIETIEDYQNAFTLDVDASMSYGLFHGSAAFNFAEKHSYDSFSRYLVVSVNVSNPLMQIPNPRLTDAASTLLKNGQLDRFREQFGDQFVIGIQTGGLYYAVLQFTSKSQEDLQNISASLDVGEFGLFDAAGNFSSAVSRYKGQTSLQVNSFQVGGTDTNPAIAIDNIIDKAQKFPAEVATKAVSFAAVLQDYRILDLPPALNPMDIANAQLVLKRYFRLRNDLVQKLNDIEYIQLHPEQFNNPEQFDLASLQQQAQNILDTITQQASQCVASVKNCKFQAPALPVFALPVRRAMDLSAFAGTWTNNDSGGDFTKLIIAGIDADLVNVTGFFTTWPPQVTATANFNGKALTGFLQTVQGSEVGKTALLPAGHNLQITLANPQGTELTVVDTFGTLSPFPDKTVTSLSFSKGGD